MKLHGRWQIGYFVADLEQQQLGGLAGFGQGHQPLATANKDLDTQLIFQLFDLLGYSRLRREQLFSDQGQVQALPGSLARIPKLLEIHGFIPKLHKKLNTKSK